MNMKRFLLLAILTVATLTSFAQRRTEQLDRGLVAIKTASGVYCSWRIMGEEYYDVTYNLYRDGVKVNDTPLRVSNFTDAAGSEASKYTVKAVVRGVEQSASKEAAVWGQNYLEITPDHGSLTSRFEPNDACMADLDGDGELEILIKMWNQSDVAAGLPREGNNGEYSLIEVYKLNGKKLWWIECGPNLTDFQNNETNIVAYDWDGDGKAEAIMRAADGTVIHMADGTTQTIGDPTKNYRPSNWGSQVEKFVHDGDEYLVYMNGETGKPYQVKEYPLRRLEAGETDLNKAWGDGYGHRSSKHFFGAPYLDGRKPSIFLARGIYTRHKMIALDVDPATHELTERWRWNCNTAGSPWYGQGYHNYAVADVDWDGRDEICFGSMVIDDNGKGLSTTGFGHGDAQHHGDFNPYVHGQEIFACIEDSPVWGSDYRDGTTSKLYYKYTSSRDEGRCIAGNFSNEYPGAMALSSSDSPISCVTADHISGLGKGDIPDNFRIYWDGDLCDEGFNYVGGKNTAGGIYKHNKGLIETLTGSMTNNDTKGTPCYLGDIFGDWREEVVMRTKDDKIRIYSTTIPTEWRLYTLWHDMQYRQAMVWQMCGYNQPPHPSYFVGELEGITQAPPALTMTGRVEVKNGDAIDNTLRDKQVLMAEAADMTVNIPQSSVDPYIFFDNAPSWVEGHDDNNNITTRYFTHTLTGGGFNGDMRLVKQGDGVLKLPENISHLYWGDTEIWAGTLVASHGGMPQSAVWVNRFGRLESYPESAPVFKSVAATYGSVLSPGGSHSNSSGFSMKKLTLGFGAIVELDVNSDTSGSVYQAPDVIAADTLVIEKKDWQYGPAYSTPVLRIIPHFAEGQTNLAPGKYMIMQSLKIEGSIDDFVIEGLDGMKCKLESETKDDLISIYLVVSSIRSPQTVTWDGGTDGVWDFAESENFKSSTGEKDIFVTGDDVTFNDEATNTSVVVMGELSPASVTFDNNAKNFTVSGAGSIIGNASLTKKGEGSLTISNVNKFTGGADLSGGKVSVAALANTQGVEYGALGGVDNTLTFNGGTLQLTRSVVSSQPVIVGSTGVIETANGVKLTQKGSINGAKKSLTKTGMGTLSLEGSAKFGALYVEQGTVQAGEISNVHQYPDTVVLNGGTLKDPDDIYSYSTNNAKVLVPEGKTATWTLDSRCDYKGKLLGKGNLTVNVTSVRCQMQGDWSQFEGIVNFQKQKTGSYEPSIYWDNSYGLGKATVTGVFDNSGKSVSIGTIQGNAVLTGSGSYTAKNLSLMITKSRSATTVTTIDVANSLTVTGEINITLRGASAPKSGEEYTLWKVGRLTTTTSVVVNLPELPTGLYWDTTDLLKPTGVLRVTDQPTGIHTIRAEQPNDGKYYTLSGMPVENPTKKGVYIRNGKKIIIK